MTLPAEWGFGGHFRLRVVDQFPEAEYQALVRANLGDPHGWEEALSQEERAAHRELAGEVRKNRPLRIAAYDQEELVGVSYGRHAEDSTFNMSISLVSPAYRRQGLYGEMLRYVLARTKQDGFLKVTSRHRATNNAVIIPKLKAGFVISGMELDPAFGTMVHLSYFHHPKLWELMEARAGI